MTAHRWPLIVLAAACLLMAGPHVWPLHGISGFGYDSRDVNIFLWNFWWTREALLDLHSPHWTDRLFYPYGTSLSFHSYPMIYSLASLPVQWLFPGTNGLAIAFNLIVFSSFLLSSYGAYRLALHVTGSPSGAVIAGFLFAYTPFRFLNTPRLHLIATEFLAFYVLAFVRFVEAPSSRKGMLVGFLLALTYHSSLEYALYLTFFSVLWLALHATQIRKEPWAIVEGAAKAALVFGLVTSPLLWTQIQDVSHRRVQVVRPLAEAQFWSPALVSLVIPSRLHPLYGNSLRFLGEYGPDMDSVRSEASLGVTALVLGTIALFRWRRDKSSAWLVAFLAFAILALGPTLRVTRHWETGLALPYRALYELVPPLRAGRDPTRFLPLAMLFLSVMAAFGVRLVLEQRWPLRARTAIACMLGALTLFETCTRWPRLVEASNAVASSYVVLARSSTPSAVMDLSPDLLGQTVHGRPITGGRVPRSSLAKRTLEVEAHFQDPAPFLALDNVNLEKQLVADRVALQRLGICYVVLEPSRATVDQKRFLQLIARRTEATGLYYVCDSEPSG